MPMLLHDVFAQIREPYRPLHDGHYAGPPPPHSPDPTSSYRWDAPASADSLQLYMLAPKKIFAFPTAAFAIAGDGITVNGSGELRFDFGVENAGWLEFDSDDLSDSVEMSISEYNDPAIVNAGARHPVKTMSPVKYGNSYRLELNDELY